MDFKTVAITAAHEAGNILMDNLEKDKNIRLKKPKDYLTDIDIASENKIKEIIQNSFPNHSIVAEESDREIKNSEYIWYIDPISSTTNYIHGLPHFAIAIALQKHTDFICSVVLDPYFNELFYAEKNKGAFLNNKQIHVSEIDAIEKSLVLAHIHPSDKIDYVGKIVSLQPGVIKSIGSTALQLCYVAAGRAETFFNDNSDIFSIPAGKVVLEEAGGKVTDFQGKDWDTTSQTVIASNGKIHESLVKHFSQ